MFHKTFVTLEANSCLKRNIAAMNYSTPVLYLFEVLMELFEGRKIEKEAYQSMYYISSLSLQQDRYLCEDNYLANPNKTYLLKKPLT